MFVAVYLIETGLLLVVAPWTIWWHRNYFAEMWPWLGAVMQWPAVHAAVPAAGIVTALGGVSDLRRALIDRFVRAGEHLPSA